MDKNGSGEGQLTEMAKLRINAQKQLEIESYEIGPQPIIAVKRWTD